LTTEFNFTKLHPVFLEAIQRHEPSIAFALAEGVGKFVFLLFMKTDSSGDIEWGELELFVLLARTQGMIRLKLLGNHKNAGNFKVRLRDEHERAIRDELGIGNAAAGPAFVLSDFLEKLNGMIPVSVSLQEKIAVIQENKPSICTHCAEYMDDASKVYLLRAGPLAPGKRPREETLRKLYMLDVPREDIAALIQKLKSVRWTAFWTASKPKTDKFAETFTKVAAVRATR
jgi:hypothetical protein